MIKKVYHLSNCTTCQRILAQVPGIEDFEKYDIKIKNISEKDLDMAADYAGSYEQVFSKRAMKYRSEGWNKKELSEKDYKNLILSEYTFLKRPVFFVNENVYIGNSKKVVSQLIEDLNGK